MISAGLNHNQVCTKATKEIIHRVLSLNWLRIVILFVLLLAVVLVRHYYQAFNISLRYLYMLLITLAAFWYGLKGGFLLATLSFAIFFSEILIFDEYYYRDLVVKGVIIRFMAYYACGIIIGILSDRNNHYKEKLNELAYYDELTGCLNYRFIIELFKRELLQNKRTGNELIVAMIDLDNFKYINDHYGHQTGNRVLRWFSSVLMQNIRNIDMAGRYGGDEFLLVFPDCNKAQVGTIFNRILTGILVGDIPGSQVQAHIFRSLKFSAGIVSFSGNGDTVEDLIDAVDKNLYKAKESGKNAIIFEGNFLFNKG